MGFGGSGGGSGSIQTSSDVALSGLSNNDVLTYNTSDTKWENKPAQGGGSYPAARVLFSTLAGANDDAKLASFISTYSGQTYKPALELDELRAYVFTQQAQIYNGFRLIGGGLSPVDQDRSSSPLPQVVKLRMGTPRGWLTIPNGTIYGVSLGSISFDGDANSRVFEPNASCVMWNTTLRDISFQNGLGILGSSTVTQGVDFLCCDGFWNFNNIQDVGFNIGGSDCFLVPTGMNLDSPTSLMGPSQYLMQFSNLSKTVISGFYVTCDQHSGFNITGGNRMLQIHNCQLEGRNANTPCYGAVVRISSDVVLRDCWTSYGMSGGNNGRSDGGVINITAGNVTIDGCFYERATGVAESVPYIYISGGNVKVSNITGSGSWTGKPVVRWIGGTLVADSSVTVVTT